MTRRRHAYRATLAASVLAILLCAAIACAASPTQAVTALNVRAFGATGNGRTDDTKAFTRAMRAAVNARATLYVPRGTYKLRALDLPDGLKIKGASSTGSWLKGRITFGSNCVVRDIKLGDAGYSTRNRANASNTRFERCRFRGGGGTDYDAAVVLLGWAYSCDHITFTDCNFERNVGGTGIDLGNNIVSLNNRPYSGGPQLDYITWERCHFGVDNGGANTITPRAAIECTNQGSSPIKGYHHMYVLDCVFEKTGSFSIDFADAYNLSDDVVISGNLIKGATGAADFAYAICLEMPDNCVVENNTIYRSALNAIKFAYASSTSNAIIRNNTFQLDYDNGITPTTSVFYITGGGSQIYGNTIVMSHNLRVWEYWDASNSVAYSNTVTNYYAGASPKTWAQFSTSSNIRIAGTGNDATRNTLETYRTADLGWTDNPASNNSNLTLTPNVLIHH